MKKLLIITLIFWQSIAFAQFVIPNEEETIESVTPAAEQGDVNSQFYLGYLYHYYENYSEAMKWYRKAIEQGSMNAEYKLGVMYHNGQGVPVDYSESLKWHKSAAEQGQGEAQVWLGHMYMSGEGVSQNYIYAYMWYHIALPHSDYISRLPFYIGLVAEKLTAAEIQEAVKLAEKCFESNYQDCPE